MRYIAAHLLNTYNITTYNIMTYNTNTSIFQGRLSRGSLPVCTPLRSATCGGSWAWRVTGWGAGTRDVSPGRWSRPRGTCSAPGRPSCPGNREDVLLPGFAPRARCSTCSIQGWNFTIHSPDTPKIRWSPCCWKDSLRLNNSLKTFCTVWVARYVYIRGRYTHTLNNTRNP